MAKEVIQIPLTSENTELGGGHLRRNSTGIIGFQNNGPKILSRYLSASTSSCHDFCKYGIKHASEAKEKSLMPRKITPGLDEGQYPEKIPTLPKKKKEMFLIRKASLDSKTEFSLSAKRVAAPKNDSSLPGSGIKVSARLSSDSKLKHLPIRTSSLSTLEQTSNKRDGNIRKSNKLEAHLKNPLKGLSSPRNGETGTEKEIGTFKLDEGGVPMHPDISFSPKAFVRGVPNKKDGNSENLKGARLKNRNNSGKAKAVLVSDENFPENTLFIIDPEAENKVDGSTQNGSCNIRSSPSLTPSSVGKGQRRSGNKVRSTTSSVSSESKNVRCTRNGLHKTQLPPSLSSSSEKKSLRHPRNRTRGTQLPSSSSPSLSTRSLSESTFTEESGAISDPNETEFKKQTSNFKVNNKGRSRRGGISMLEYSRSPRKLHFREGRVVDLQSDQNNSPRRLKFRRGRVLGENSNGKNDTLRRNFRRREAVHSEINGPKARSEKVVLRHQNVEGKKDCQSLFNNVIEETASKLVKTRKSKVKALVGAFETLISLQDTKPVAVTSMC